MPNNTYVFGIEHSFALSYIHSVHQSLVKEWFEIRGRYFYLTALEFYNFGAGMPTEAEIGQILTVLDNGRIRLSNINRRMNALNLLVGTDTDHTLHINSFRIGLNQGPVRLFIHLEEEF
ncbi:MAG: DUF1850 domain-containing protein [Defluviitaleaceae bacterium]|nr:DUF1850 domain-containing protein [Defluviitaleaceae bacterium]